MKSRVLIVMLGLILVSSFGYADVKKPVKEETVVEKTSEQAIEEKIAELVKRKSNLEKRFEQLNNAKADVEKQWMATVGAIQEFVKLKKELEAPKEEVTEEVKK